MICLGCLEERRTKQNYCVKCTKELFGVVSPKPLEFDKKEFYQARVEFAKRMSISGVQDKILLKFENKKLIPVASQGEYILKPAPFGEVGMSNPIDLPANEHLSMIISKKIFKIRTAECGLIRFSDGELAYITKRFDYVNAQEKFDQEDFASVLGVTPAKDGADYKYSSKTYIDCVKALKAYTPASMINILDFVKRIILNYLISNGDAHLKNFSLYSLPNKNDLMLTPNYDVLNTRYHIKNESSDIAMELFDTNTKEFDAIGFLSHQDFKKFATFAGLSQNQFISIIKQASNVEEVEKIVNRSYLSEEGKKFYIESYRDRLYKRLLYNPKIICK